MLKRHDLMLLEGCSFFLMNFICIFFLAGLGRKSGGGVQLSRGKVELL